MIYLTYDINKNNDGMGAQYQRIIGIICIALYYNYEYVHTPIENMEHLDNNDYLEKIEDFFQIKNNFKNVNQYNYDNIISLDNPSIYDIESISNASSDINVLIKIFLPYNICENKIEIYEKGMPYLRKIMGKYEDNQVNIAIHVRRGDVSQTNNSFRYTPLDDIINVIHSLKEKYVHSNFHIFTQVNEHNQHEFDELIKDTSITLHENEDQIETIKYLINSDVLIICKSSFSYLAGLYNNNTVYYNNFWHKPLTNWNPIESLFS